MVRFISKPIKEASKPIPTLNSTMVRFIYNVKNGTSMSFKTFKFHYGKIHIKPFSQKWDSYATLNSTMVRFILYHLGTMKMDYRIFKFHYGKIHMVNIKELV